MKKIILIILIFTFVSATYAGNNVASFDLSKANTSQSSLLKGIEGELFNWGGISCLQCERNVQTCISSGQLPRLCFYDYIACLDNCTGPIP